jgi:ferredoxin-NADP reductase
VAGVSAMTSASFPVGGEWIQIDPDCVMWGEAAFQHHMYASFGGLLIETDVYECTPPLFMLGMREALLDKDVAADNIHYEVFGPDSGAAVPA